MDKVTLFLTIAYLFLIGHILMSNLLKQKGSKKFSPLKSSMLNFRQKQTPNSPLEKLKAYYELARDSLSRAEEADRKGDKSRALDIYQIGLQAIDEGLNVDAHKHQNLEVGNVARQRKDLCEWRELALERVEVLSGRKPRNIKQMTPANAKNVQHVPVRASGSNVGGSGIKMKPKAGKQAENSGNQKMDQYRETIMGEVLVQKPTTKWKDVVGLEAAKQQLQEAAILPVLKPELFRGLRQPARGILLYGPPGNGKTFLAKALAHEAKATFFNISASSLTSKWHGEAEKLVRALFELARENQPSIIFIDEVDSILTQRSGNEHDASRRLKTEFLVQFDGLGTEDDRVVVLGATNRPQELDDAMRRRFSRRIYIPLPDIQARRAMFSNILESSEIQLSNIEATQLINQTAGFSASDIKNLCGEAAMMPLREKMRKNTDISRISSADLRPIKYKDFQKALQVVRPSVDQETLEQYQRWTKEFGMGGM
eukprot:TRINITY_DN4695_c0_g1_i1.p1 TRINITY_DN4695_c0_g1~~TRINITY_DN4695_c0_g1_i1.p1  ORF type:complete len:484 (-),score=64.00 TRINITY_DN4695_c0_g1_i1:118-1569(-)